MVALSQPRSVGRLPGTRSLSVRCRCSASQSRGCTWPSRRRKTLTAWPDGASSRARTQYRYDCDGERVRSLRQLPLFPTGTGWVAATLLIWLDDEFLNKVSLVEASDVAFVLRQLGLRALDAGATPCTAGDPADAPVPQSAHQSPAIARWRSAERNAMEYIKAFEAVLGIADVSQANLGYDLEVTLKNGRRKLVEVKSVSSFSEPIRLTSNEYASAASSGRDYILAIVINGDQFSIRFFSDPVSTLSFERRCVRWSWQCNEYASAADSHEESFSAPGQQTNDSHR